MRRILLIALISSLIVGSFAGVAAARLSSGAPATTAPAAPFVVPAAAPAADAEHVGAFGYASSTAIARAMAGGSKAAADSSPRNAAGAATVTVTATVLPTVTIKLDADERVTEIITNTPDRGIDEVLYVIRDADGELRPALSASTWQDVRAALAHVTAGTGVIFSA